MEALTGHLIQIGRVAVRVSFDETGMWKSADSSASLTLEFRCGEHKTPAECYTTLRINSRNVRRTGGGRTLGLCLLIGLSALQTVGGTGPSGDVE